MTQHKTDIIVIGSGMAGLSFAAMAAQEGHDVTVVDRIHPETLATEDHDARTVALSAGSRDILMPLRIWDDIVPHAAAITSIDVQEGHDPFVLNFDTKRNKPPAGIELPAQEDENAFGWIFPNTIVRQALYDAAIKHGVKFIAPAMLKNIEHDADHVIAVLQDGQRIEAKLLVGADGRQSRVRDLLGVPVVNIDYHHVALVGLVEHEFPHDGLAVERFYPTGPFAVLPFVNKGNKHRSAIVWSQDVNKRQKKTLPSLDTITTAITPLFDARYGKINAIGKWAQYPLSLAHAKEFIGSRVALISDAAHAIHPIAGQGLNLGMRDVDVLLEELYHAKEQNEDIGGPFVLESYQQRRRFDVFAMIAATDLLNRLFGNKSRTVAKIRSLGLGMVDKIGPLKRFFANTAMGK